MGVKISVRREQRSYYTSALVYKTPKRLYGHSDNVIQGSKGGRRPVIFLIAWTAVQDAAGKQIGPKELKAYQYSWSTVTQMHEKERYHNKRRNLCMNICLALFGEQVGKGKKSKEEEKEAMGCPARRTHCFLMCAVSAGGDSYGGRCLWLPGYYRDGPANQS